MPLPPADPREALHCRDIRINGYRRRDGLYEVEGRIVDTKTYPLKRQAPERDTPPGLPLHDMSVRIVFDDDMLVHDVVAATDASPFPVCPEAAPALSVLKGARMGPGWSSRIREALGGRKGCTHLVELLMPLATVAFQTLSPVRMARPDKLDAGGRPVKIDSCHAYRSDGEIVRRRWPSFFSGRMPEARAAADD